MCKIEGCNRKIKCRELCSLHYQRWRRHGEPEIDKRANPDVKRRQAPRPHLRGENSSAWRGGFSITQEGYKRVKIYPDSPFYSMVDSNGYVREHRLVMAKKLKRPLYSTEQVHHINGDRLDNRLENLQLRSGHHGPGVVRVCNSCGSSDVKEVEID